jgi:proline racemase
VAVTNLPSFAQALSVPLDVPGLGRLTVDTAFGGDSFVVVEAGAMGLSLVPAECRHLAELGTRISAAATEQIGFRHPTLPDWRHISFCLFAAPIERDGAALATRHAVAVRPGKIDRSPTGTAISARMALLAARGEMAEGDVVTARSVIESTFTGRILGPARIGEVEGIRPEIAGRAWITGIHQHILAPDDPWPEGYRLSDTWPGA